MEALRLGIVPDDGLALFTYGREAELANLQSWLLDPNDPARLVIGGYGTGKTHLLNYVQSLALNAGWAVSLVEMDPQAMPFSMPKRVYHQVVRNLRWKNGDEVHGFRSLLTLALNRGLLRDHAYFKYLRGQHDPRLWEWIDGSSSSIRPQLGDDELTDCLPALYDFTTAANIYCYLLSGLGSASCHDKIGLKGLLVLFDESETLHAARGQKMERSLNFLNAMIKTAGNERRLQRSADQLKDLTYAGHAPNIPFLYDRPSGLKLVFAFTSIDDLEDIQEFEALPHLELAPLSTDQWVDRLLHLSQVYHLAYPSWDGVFNRSVFEELFDDHMFSTTRAMVKGFVEILDINRFGTYASDGDV